MFHKHGGDIYEYKNIRDFSANINFRGMMQSVCDAASEAVARSVHYPDPEYRSLRNALAQRENALLKKKVYDGTAARRSTAQDMENGKTGSAKNNGKLSGTRIGPQHIICGNGAAELMFALAAARRPKQALLAAPSFFEYEQALTAFGCGIRRFYMKAEEDFALREGFLDAVEEKIDIIILGNPNNPTGRLLESGFLLKLLKLCREHRILLVLDESFFDFLCEADQAKTFSGAGEILENPNVFVIKSFTKMYAMPGLRFGYGLCGDEALLQAMRQMMQPWNVSVPAQAAAEAASGELDFARETARLTAAGREDMKLRMEQLGYQVFSSDTNFLLFAGPENLKEFCLQQGVLIRDCSNFPGLEKGFFRICIRSEEENHALLGILEAALKEVKQEWRR